MIDIIDDVITPLVDVDDGHDDANLEDVVEPDFEATDVEYDDENMSIDSDY